MRGECGFARKNRSVAQRRNAVAQPVDGDDDVMARRSCQRVEMHAMSASKLMMRLRLRRVVRVTGMRDRIQCKAQRQSEEQCS